jgi:tetratricopeptide (TPR) repeat protein
MSTVSQALADAVQHYQAKRLQAAEHICLQILAVDPFQTEALHLLGVVALQVGQYDAAAQHIGRAIDLNESEPSYHSNLGNVLKAQGKLQKAEHCYRKALELRPDFAEVYHNLGTTLHGQGKLDAAIAAYQRATELKPDFAESYYNLGIAFQAQEKLNESIASYEQAIVWKFDLAEAHYNLGTVYQAQGNLDKAVACFRRALEINSNSADAHTNLGKIFHTQAKFEEAVASYRRARDLKPGNAIANYNLGKAFKDQGKLEEAVVCYQRALELNPEYAEAHSNLGNVYNIQKNLEEAVSCYRRALRLKPDFTEVHNNLGNALQAQGKVDEAISAYLQALELKPDYAEAHFNLGNVFREQSKLDDAVNCYRRALELKPDYPEALGNLGNTFRLQGKLEEAVECLQRVVKLNPDYADAQGNLSLLLLARGDYERGWLKYEWRWKTKQLKEPTFSQPRWDGSPLGAQTIVLHAEQGFGDTLQFIRYAALVKKRNPTATVVLKCQSQLVRLLEHCPGIDYLAGTEGDLPRFHVHCPLLSLPTVLKTTVTTIPAEVPYLSAEAALVQHWRSWFGARSGLRIGITWQGRTGPGEHLKRNIPLQLILALAEQIPGISLISLQKGATAAEFAGCNARVTVLVPGPDIDSTNGAFVDTAAIMTNLDLIISSDTAVPHLAGALGVPVWLALPFAADWRWLIGRTDSPWYPAMRLFRQKTAGDWDTVFGELAAELYKVVQRKR